MAQGPFDDILAPSSASTATNAIPSPSLGGPFDDILSRSAPATPVRAPGPLSFNDIVDNVWHGVAQGSLLIPDRWSDAPSNPSKVAEIVGIAAGAIGEGALTQSYLLRGLQALSKGKTFAVGAQRALHAFGVGEKVDLFRAVTGSALLGATVEGSIRVAAGQPVEDVLKGAGLAAIPGAAVGAGVAAYRVGKTANALYESRRAIDDLPSDLRARIGESIIAPAKPSTMQEIGVAFQRARSSIKDAFQYEHNLQKFTGFDPRIPEVNLADEFHALSLKVNRGQRQAVDDLAKVFEPLHALPKERAGAAAQDFMHLVIFRGLKETAERGLSTGKLSLADINETLGVLEARALPEVKVAAELHKALASGMKDQLVARGRIPAEAGYDNYYPHQVLQSLADADYRLTGGARKDLPTTALSSPTRPYTKERGGTQRAILGDYVEVMNRALRKFYRDNAVDDFLGDLERTHSIPLASLTPDDLSALRSFGDSQAITLANGARVKRVSVGRLQGTPAAQMDEVVGDVVEDAAAQMDGNGMLADLIKPPTRSLLLPEEIATRVERYYQPDPLWVRSGPLGVARKLTAEWKYNTIWWGLSRFAVFQIVGDAVNTARSFPGAFVRFKDGKVESAALKALQAQFAFYRTPMASTQQALGSLAGALGGAAATEEDASGGERLRNALAAAGLGYIVGTAHVAGTARSKAHLARLYEDADEFGAINSGFVFSEEDLARRTLGRGGEQLGQFGRTTGQRTYDTILTALSGKTHGDPFFLARKLSDTIGVIQTERENWLRLASYIHQIEDGIAPKLAAKQASAALVDYSRFTEFENKVVRGFMLPFYSFYRHNIPNWLKMGVGKDVGGKGKLALAAGAGIASFDLAAQMWNEQFFPDVEKNLDPFMRRQFHIVMGDAKTGTPMTDKHGRALVFGAEMPYEQALELFGLARPGALYSEFFGMPIGDEESLVQRATNIDAFEKLPAALKRPLEGMSNMFLELLTPAAKLPAEIMSNKNWHFGTPIVPERYRGTPEAWDAVLDHMARTAFRQYREVARTATAVEGDRYDPLTSAFGLGAPVNAVDLDRQLKKRLHERMREASLEDLKKRARWQREIDLLIGERVDENVALPEEGARLSKIVVEHVEDPTQVESAVRYYVEKASKAPIMRHFESLSMAERAAFLNSLEPADQTALLFYMNGGERLSERAEATPVGGGALTGF